VDPIDLAVGAALNCLDREGVLVVLDSMLNQRKITDSDARTYLTASRYRHLHLAEQLDRNSESGLETMARVRLRALQIHLRTQVTIGIIGRVDLLVGTSLVIETDGWDTHKGKRQQDIERDRQLHARGYVVIRLSYDDVVHRWNESLADILAVIRRRGHLRPVAN
jgi:very-short-patch-repair endonuclease